MEATEVFVSLSEFVLHLKECYDKLNYDNETIKTKVAEIYAALVFGVGEVRYLRLTRWLPTQFGFKYKNVNQKEFWIERGWFNREVDIKLSDSKPNYVKKVIDRSFFKCSGEGIEVRYKSASFTSNTHPVCNCCGSNLDIKSYKSKKGPYYKVLGCPSKVCDSKNKKGHDLYACFVPVEIATQHVNKLKSEIMKRNPLCVEYWELKGLSTTEAREEVFKIQSHNSKQVKNRFVVSKDRLKNRGYSDSEISEICQAPSQKEFWISKGLSNKEAKDRLSDNQSYAASFVDFDSRLLPSNKEYWMKKGLSKEESMVKVSEHQSTFSLDKCIEKHGEKEGRKRFTERQVKWQKSLTENGNMKMGYSKISQDLFFDILKFYEKGLGNVYFATKNEEYRLPKENGGIWLYDYADVEKQKIIEYNGDQYHANPSKYLSEDYPHPFRKGDSAKEIWAKDKIKVDRAKEKGFEVLVIWDSEYRKDKKVVLDKCLKFLGVKKK